MSFNVGYYTGSLLATLRKQISCRIWLYVFCLSSQKCLISLSSPVLLLPRSILVSLPTRFLLLQSPRLSPQSFSLGPLSFLFSALITIFVFSCRKWKVRKEKKGGQRKRRTRVQRQTARYVTRFFKNKGKKRSGRRANGRKRQTDKGKWWSESFCTNATFFHISLDTFTIKVHFCVSV